VRPAAAQPGAAQLLDDGVLEDSLADHRNVATIALQAATFKKRVKAGC
jgi:hypothetical protein